MNAKLVFAVQFYVHTLTSIKIVAFLPKLFWRLAFLVWPLKRVFENFLSIFTFAHFALIKLYMFQSIDLSFKCWSRKCKVLMQTKQKLPFIFHQVFIKQQTIDLNRNYLKYNLMPLLGIINEKVEPRIWWHNNSNNDRST